MTSAACCIIIMTTSPKPEKCVFLSNSFNSLSHNSFVWLTSNRTLLAVVFVEQGMRHTHGTARRVCRFVFMEAALQWSHDAIFWQFYINQYVPLMVFHIFQHIRKAVFKEWLWFCLIFLFYCLLCDRNKHLHLLYFSLQFPLFIPIGFVLSCVFMIAVSFWAAPFECLVGSSIILTGIPAYLLGYKWKKPHVVKKMLGEWEMFVFA